MTLTELRYIVTLAQEQHFGRDGRGSIEKDRQSKKPRRRFLHNDKHYQIVYPPRLFER
ncbi:hypothetical protein NAG22_14535 [Pseudomonas aeruginosa]|nr:hypothetical protein [Pseudomonas aeruginosa]